MNLAYGASIGAVAGLGLFLYELAAGSSQDTRESNNVTRAERTATQTSESRSDLWKDGYVPPSSRPVSHVIWMPVVSLAW